MQVGALTLILNSTWKYHTTVRYGDNNNLSFHRSVKCVEINKESELSFEKSVSRLPKTIDSTISWHNTDASLVCSAILNLLMDYDMILPAFGNCLVFEDRYACRNLFAGLRVQTS